MTTRIHSAAAAACALAAAFVLAVGIALPPAAYAAVSAVYTADAVATYENPITGEIEDSAGESNVALGESMVESIVYEGALIERDTDGALYASLRFNLADQIDSMSFEVSADGKAYESVDAKQMQTGTANDMETADYRIQVPSEDAYIRCEMDVIPMGRVVTYFIALENAEEGDSDGTFVVTVTSGEGAEEEEPAASDDDATEAADAESDEAEEPEPSTESSGSEGVQEFNEEGRDVTGSDQASNELDGTAVATIVGVAVVVIAVACAVVYAAYVRPKRAKQAEAAAAAAAAASAPVANASGKDASATEEAKDESRG